MNLNDCCSSLTSRSSELPTTSSSSHIFEHLCHAGFHKGDAIDGWKTSK